MAKKVVRGVMIIQKNADAPAHPRPPAWTRKDLDAQWRTGDFESIAIPLTYRNCGARNAERWENDGEEMAMARESAMAWNASTYHDALMR